MLYSTSNYCTNICNGANKYNLLHSNVSTTSALNFVIVRIVPQHSITRFCVWLSAKVDRQITTTRTTIATTLRSFMKLFFRHLTLFSGLSSLSPAFDDTFDVTHSYDLVFGSNYRRSYLCFVYSAISRSQQIIKCKYIHWQQTAMMTSRTKTEK